MVTRYSAVIRVDGWGDMNSGTGGAGLSLNQATVKRLSLRDAADLCVRHGIPAIGLWRDRVAEIGTAESVATVRAAGLRVSSLCRGGFFTHADAAARAAALADNRAAIAEAAELEADTLVLVSGGLVPGTKELGLARRMIRDAIAYLVPIAERAGVRLGIEPLHPMFCADRCVISRLGEALDLAAEFPADSVGVVVDTYHVWWDSALATDLARASGRIVSYQLADWVVPLPADALLGRGHIGDGSIDFEPITVGVTAAGYRGFTEVEIFNQEIWDAPPDETAAKVVERCAAFARVEKPASTYHALGPICHAQALDIRSNSDRFLNGPRDMWAVARDKWGRGCGPGAAGAAVQGRRGLRPRGRGCGPGPAGAEGPGRAG